MRSESWFCLKTCIVCGATFRARSGFTKMCDGCRAKPCPRCGHPVKKWSGGVCSLCYGCAHYAANREVHSQHGHEYYLKNAERIKARWAEYRRTHPDVIKAGSLRYGVMNRLAMQGRSKRARQELRLQMVMAYGGRCKCCGETEPKFLCIHHVGNDGKADRANGYGGISLFAKLRREGWPKGRYKLLCHNCNNAIRVLGECPHQSGKTVQGVADADVC